MIKRIMFVICGLGLIAATGILHFVPVIHERGSINRDSATCKGYAEPQEYKYRVILGELGEYDAEKALLESPGSGGPCSEPVDLRLYLW